MSDIKTILLSDIYVPERLRELDRANAMYISDSIKRQGLMHPITVRLTPAQKGGKYTLVAGRHRMEAVFLADSDEIEAFIVKTDEQGARLKEIEENLFRNDLSKLDRAIFVTEFRRLWELEHGAIKQGGDQKDKLSLWSMSEVGGSFIQNAAERLGIHERSVKRLQRIGLNLDPNLRKKLAGTPDADNLSLLTKLVDMGPEKQAGVVRALGVTGMDIKGAMAAAMPEKPKLSERNKIKSRLLDSWLRAHIKDREWFLDQIGVDPELAATLAAKKVRDV